MTIRNSRSLQIIKLDYKEFIRAHPSLIQDVATYSLAGILYSRTRISRLTRSCRRKLRKLRNRKHRWFVDNIIMHHKRMCDHNTSLYKKRKKILDEEKQRKLKLKNKNRENSIDDSFKWRNSTTNKERSSEIRQRIQAKKIRAMSRWATLLN